MKSLSGIQNYIFRRKYVSKFCISEKINPLTIQSDKVSATPYENIPGPKPLPLLGNTWRFFPYIGDFDTNHVDKLSKRLYVQYGNIVKIEKLLGRPDVIFLYDPDEIEKIFRQEDAMPHRPSMPSLDYYKHVYKKGYFEKYAGVLAVHGIQWQNFRSKVNHIMLQPKSVKMYVRSMVDTAEEFVRRIEQIQDDINEMPPDFLNELHKWSLESIAKFALDTRLGCLDKNAPPDTQKLIHAVSTFFETVPLLKLRIPFWRIFNTPTFKKYLSALDTINETTLKYINNAISNFLENGTKEPSILQKFVEAENDTKIATVLGFDMFLVGIDTTSNSTSSILYQLAINPEKQEILHNEIVEVLPNTECMLTYEKLESMSYLKACIKETMRMFPVVLLNGRCTSREYVVCGYTVPKGVQVVFQHYVISNSDRYFPKSEEFIPERWLTKKLKTEKSQHHPFASLPFGFGKRMCIGRRFAELEMQTLITKVIQTYKIEYHHDKLDYYINPMYAPNGPLKLRFIKRRNGSI